MKALTLNQNATRDYELMDKWESGLVLKGHEVKAAKKGLMSLKGAFVKIQGQEVWLINSYISPYQPKNLPEDYNPSRPRKLLLNRREIKNLLIRMQKQGLTLIPWRVYNKNGKLKLEFALGRGKKKFDKREEIRKRDFKREKARIIKGLQ